MEKEKYMNFLENSRDGGVISNIVIDAIEDYIGFYTDDVDWEDVEESLGACSSSGWLTYTQDLMEFYSKNYNEVDSIINQDEPQSIWGAVQKLMMLDAIGAVCYRAYDIVLSDIVKKLKAL